MGYYTGNGVVTGGGSTVSLRSTGPAVGGAYYTYQRRIYSTITKNGVSLATAQGQGGDMDLTYWQWPGGAVEPACRGTVTEAMFQQVNDSNLYVLRTTNAALQVRGKQGTYDSGWVS